MAIVFEGREFGIRPQAETAPEQRLPFLVKVGSLTVVARSASDVVSTVDRLLSDDDTLEPEISTFEGSVVDIDQLRGLVGDGDEP
jgi:hypothetical protein